jgi:hypothetical protein
MEDRNRDPIVDMSPAKESNTAWFTNQEIPVQGFERTACPHGLTLKVQEHNRTDSTYKCTECGQEMVAKIIEEDEE